MRSSIIRELTTKCVIFHSVYLLQYFLALLPFSSASPTLGLRDGFLLIMIQFVPYDCFCF